MAPADSADAPRERVRARLIRGAALCAVLCLAAALRFYGSPFFHPDEHLVVDQAKYMPLQHYMPTVFNYPHFYPMLVAFVHQHWPGFGIRLHGAWATQAVGAERLEARSVTALLGTLTVLVVYLCGAALGWPLAGLGGAMFLAVSMNHVENSHYATVDVPMAMLATVAFLFTCLHYRRGGAVWALMGGIFCGLTIGTKYNGALILAPFAVCLAAVAWRRGGLRGALGVLAGIAAVPYGFLLACPYFLSMHAKYIEAITCSIHLYAGGFIAYDSLVGPPNWIWNALYLARTGMGLLPSLLALAGCAMLLASGVVGWIAASFPVLYYAFISHQAVRITRSLTVLIPFLCLAAGYALWRAGSRVRRGRGGIAGAALLAAVAFAQPLLISSRFALMMGRPDPRWEALGWARTHIPRGSKIAMDFMYGPPFPKDTYAITSEQLQAHPLTWYIEQGYDYIVTSTGYFPHWCPEANPAFARIYSELANDFTRATVFPGNELGINQGYYSVAMRPTIAVYNLHLPRFAATRIIEPPAGSASPGGSCRIRWAYADASGGAPPSGYQLRLERRRPGTVFAEAEDLLSGATASGGWARESHIPGYSGEGFLAAHRNAPPFRGSIPVEKEGTYNVWVHQVCNTGGKTSITLGELNRTLKPPSSNIWFWERLGTVRLGKGRQPLGIDHAGEGYSVIDSITLAEDPAFDPSKEGKWVPALDTGEVASAETDVPPGLLAGLEPGGYRARVRARSAGGRWGLWSAPVEFRLVP